MNRHFSYLQRANKLPVPTFKVKHEIPQVTRGKFDDLLDLIYAVDERTGMPSGDLAIFTSENANPEIRAFIQQNLLNEVPSEKGKLPLPESVRNSFNSKISDDDIASLSRNVGESTEEYAERLSNHVRDMKLAYQREMDTKRLNALRKKQFQKHE